MMLKDKVAVVYGAGGAIGGAVALAFACEGAHVFATGHRRPSVDDVVRDIVEAGGNAEAATIDALDETAVAQHLQYVSDIAGRVDISFNAVGVPNQGILGARLTDLDVEAFSRPITAYATSYFLTARTAARHMIPNKSGVIMTVTALPSRTGTTLNGGYGSAMAAKEALTRDLSAELAPYDVRVVNLRPHGIAQTSTMLDVFALKVYGISYDQFEQRLASTTHPQRMLALAEVANVAVFMASDKASAMTGTSVNLSMGSLND